MLHSFFMYKNYNQKKGAIMKVLGVSGSPIKDSNTDRAVKAALKATGVETDFVKLIDYNIAPCNACLECVKTNVCVQNDDGMALVAKAKEADALIVGAYTPYSSLDARTKAFLERLYPLRHLKGYMTGKPGGAIVTTAVPEGNSTLPPAGDLAVNSIMYYMMEEGMNFVGSVKVLGNVPCVRCGRPDCDMNGLKMVYGQDATIKSVGINDFEKQEHVFQASIELGKKILEVLKEANK